MQKVISSARPEHFAIGIALFGGIALHRVFGGHVRRCFSSDTGAEVVKELKTKPKKSPLYTRTGDKGTSSVSFNDNACQFKWCYNV
jgi:hypothetical protein